MIVNIASAIDADDGVLDLRMGRDDFRMLLAYPDAFFDSLYSNRQIPSPFSMPEPIVYKVAANYSKTVQPGQETFDVYMVEGGPILEAACSLPMPSASRPSNFLTAKNTTLVEIAQTTRAYVHTKTEYHTRFQLADHFLNYLAAGDELLGWAAALLPAGNSISYRVNRIAVKPSLGSLISKPTGMGIQFNSRLASPTSYRMDFVFMTPRPTDERCELVICNKMTLGVTRTVGKLLHVNLEQLDGKPYYQC